MNKDQSPGVIQIKSHSLELNAEERTRDRERMNEKTEANRLKRTFTTPSIMFVAQLTGCFIVYLNRNSNLQLLIAIINTNFANAKMLHEFNSTAMTVPLLFCPTVGDFILMLNILWGDFTTAFAAIRIHFDIMLAGRRFHLGNI